MVKKTRKKQSKPKVSPPRQKASSNLKQYTLWTMVAILFFAFGMGAYWYITSVSVRSHVATQLNEKSVVSTDVLMQKMKKMLEDEKLRQSSLPPLPESNLSKPQPTVVPAIEPRVFEENSSQPLVVLEENSSKKQELSEVHEYQQSLKESGEKAKPHDVVRKKYPSGTTPKLAIIIDDVSFPWQTRMMKEIPYKVTPAFFPPTKGHPETVRLSHEFPFAMVHLPLEAKYYSRPEEDTLNTTDSIEVIEKRIKRIKEWFPHIVYYNNHTGGYFTSDYGAMDRLIKVMKDHNLSFVDSRTIGNSKAPQVAKKYNMFLYSRDIFLDNSLEKTAIQKQLKEAVSKAKKHGYAIAIGHPHKNTLEVLRDSKALLEGVEMVYLKEL